jgi:hypothetical protein
MTACPVSVGRLAHFGQAARNVRDSFIVPFDAVLSGEHYADFISNETQLPRTPQNQSMFGAKLPIMGGAWFSFPAYG